MKTIRIAMLLLILVSAPAVSFAQAFADGSNLVFVGFGLPPGTKLTEQNEPVSPLYSVHTLHNYGTAILRYEHGMHKYFGIGINLEYSASSDVYTDGTTSSQTYNTTINRSVIGGYLRMNGHYPATDKLDFYAGVGLGYLYTLDHTDATYPVSSQNNSTTNKALNFDWQASVGARFMVKQGFGVFAEVGYATTACQVGFVLKF
jgi:hypothetical protein